ncbi:hypothetical protein G9F71_012570 [Clostridium sp. FP2]|uniref:HEPN domain-containing protein n=1 Tax=Clostridium sp. FP2 TaxID=2724481 RepID=UPI0013E8F6C5|nr:HEPN domain-containing protein [Clostridium sp. FP2]MBZ9623683.1 hypothetical protein [Clostridium sp. FP2]
MKIADDKIDKLCDVSEQVVCSGINEIYKYQKSNSYIPSYYNYPEEFFKGIEKADVYKEMIEKVPAMKSSISFFHRSNYNTPKKYGDVLKSSDGQFSINCNKLEQYDVLLKAFNDDEALNKMIASEPKYIENSVVRFISNIVNRYLYVTKRFEEEEIDVHVVKELISEQLLRYTSETLNVNICIPICFLDFDSDEIEITDKITISKMTKDFQLSRFNVSNYESTQESHVVQCAAFMIRMTDYQIKNEEKDSARNASTNYWAYPREIIDDIFAAIRISTGCNTGYGQFLIEPIGWADEWIANLIPLYGAQIRAFNRNDVDTKFLQHKIYRVTTQEIVLTRELFDVIRKKREPKKNSKELKRVFIAIDRLNRCMLRESDDDTALDAIIGIETLLSGDAHGEITYTISNRIAVVIAKLDDCPYSANEARKAMKIIYGFRSDIVHGRDAKKNKIIVINGQERYTKELAVEFLRYSLLFIMKNNEYLDVKRFEDALDEAIENRNAKNSESESNL